MARRGVGRGMLENRGGDAHVSREAASPVGGDAAPGRGNLPRPGSPGRGSDLPRPGGGRSLLPRPASGRGVQPRPDAGRGDQPRPPQPSPPGRGGSPPPGVASVVPSRSSLSSVSVENVDFKDEVIEAIRNLPESHSDSLEFLAIPIHLKGWLLVLFSFRAMI
ncbi:UNVERIFIED_CONTAM: hypothetical protein Sradi_4335400 [Sesamum radiatum]|uniref:Uncharacterized protein n=1 Tax=Sesamum radiatum TaxID=300843 RepID=A0AAW2NRA2_SESRA